MSDRTLERACGTAFSSFRGRFEQTMFEGSAGRGLAAARRCYRNS